MLIVVSNEFHTIVSPVCTSIKAAAIEREEAMQLKVFSSGDWHVKRGEEDAFIAAWREHDEWTRREFSAAGSLFRDRDDPRHFITLRLLPSDEAMATWRATAGFAERMSRLRSHVETSTPRTLELVAGSA